MVTTGVISLSLLADKCQREPGRSSDSIYNQWFYWKGLPISAVGLVDRYVASNCLKDYKVKQSIALEVTEQLLAGSFQLNVLK